jgi:hypothetical protein
MSNFKVSQLPASVELAVEDILPVVDVSQMLTKKAEVGDLIDLAANTIESMPNLIVDPENNFTNFSQAVRNELTGGDGITYTAATGEVKLTNKSITINGNTVNLGGSTTIPTGSTYTAGTGISISPTNVISNTSPGTTTTLSSGGTLSSNLTFSPSSGNVTATLSVNPIFRSLRVVKDNLGDTDQSLFGFIGLFSSSIAQASLTVQTSQTSDALVPAALITNNGIGPSFIVEDTASDTSRFIINNVGSVGIGVDTNPLAKLEIIQTSGVAAVRIVNSGIANSLEVLDDTGDTTNFFVDAAGNVGIGLSGIVGSATAKLDISQPAGSQPAIRITNLGTGNSLEVLDSSTDTTKFIIDNDGNVGIGVNTIPTATKLAVSGNVTLNGSYTNKSIVFPSGSGATQFDFTVNDTHNIIVPISDKVAVNLPVITTSNLGIEYTIKRFVAFGQCGVIGNSQPIIDFFSTTLVLNNATKNQTVTLKAIQLDSDFGWLVIHFSEFVPGIGVPTLPPSMGAIGGPIPP